MADGDQARAIEALQAGSLPGEMGITWQTMTAGQAVGRFTVQPRHMAPNGFLHAAAVVGLTDSACGFGCMVSLPEGANSFTTIELKTNYLASAKVGEVVIATARMVHGGRMTQVWDADAVNETTGKTIALFRCTQMILYPR